jgi:hypothetical protein
MTTFLLIMFHIIIFYIIGVLFAYGYIDLNNKFESRRGRSGQKMGGTYKDYFITKKNMFKSFYFFVEVWYYKKY